MDAGKLDRRFRFERREEIDDSYGNQRGDWIYQFTRSGNLEYRRGGEAVIAGRLEGRQPAILTVWRDSDTRQIQSDWRCIEQEEGTVFAIKGPPMRTRDRLFLQMDIEAGVAA